MPLSRVFIPERIYPELGKADSLEDPLVQNWLKLARNSNSQLRFWYATSRFGRFIEEHYWSSGQRRLLSLISGLVQLPTGSTILIDEPELSLHVDWQTELVDAIIDALPDSNIILATHSPSIIEKHVSKVIPIPPEGGQ